jgi:RNA polymerase sigma-70 factor (ECF subfamily)
MAKADELRGALVGLLPDLRAYARFLVRDPSRADDLVQEAALRALSAADQFQSGTSLKAWVFTIQRNLFLQQARSRRREDAALAARHAEAAVEPVTQPPAGEIAELGRMLAQLPASLREALVLVGAGEMSHEEAAAICGVPVGTMRARVSRARARLARAYWQGAAAAPEDCRVAAGQSGAGQSGAGQMGAGQAGDRAD